MAAPGAAPLDLTAHLGPFADELALWDIAGWRHLETRTHQIPANWKIVTDTFTEGYHIPVLHKDSVGPMIAGGLNAYHAFGDHQREVFAMKSLEELRDVPREDRNAFVEGRMIFTYDIYPNTILQIGGDHAESYRIFPGDTVGSSVCVHSFFTYGEPDSAEVEQHRQSFEFFFNLVGREDFRIAAGIQKGLSTGAYDTHLYGRMEPATQVWRAAFQRDTEPGLPVDASFARSISSIAGACAHLRPDWSAKRGSR
jgi:phenylpropionate dioxygenase-like ring-hydroxylating dioxygenase large terminal subunit